MKRISEVSKTTGLTKRTLQYYDDEGILKAQRSKNNHRLYNDVDLQTIWEILILQEMKLELKDIKSILKLSPAEKNRYLQYWVEIIRIKIKNLNDDIQFAEYFLENGIPGMPKDIEQDINYKAQVQNLKTQILEKRNCNGNR